ncbi:Pathogenesis-related protein 1 [Sesamum angolense]|uniref:Pathogenesis-related protein 1 n=1 Tax=Sesamum angolense TaxID=2727404 RepID=A0AAE2BVY7_9LAMI|nr:Pathogenesis-related protein 1 [Sesamum angolense]
MAFNFEVETELKSNAEKVWDALKQHATIFPKAAPDKYDSVEVLEGDGLSVGSVVLFTKTETNGNATIMKQRIELVDEANKTLIYNVIGGNIMKYYKSYKSITSVSDKQGDSDGDGDGALVKCRVEFEKAAVEQQVPDPQLLKTFILQLFHQMDAYLLNTTPN